MTKPEVLLWIRLSRRQLGVRFRPQTPVGDYVLDFYSYAVGLAVEVDGPYHDGCRESDATRTSRLKTKFGVRKVMRFSNEAVLCNIDDVVDRIRVAVDDLKSTTT